MLKREEQELSVALMELDDASDAADELQIPDLLAALEASLAKAQAERGAADAADEEIVDALAGDEPDPAATITALFELISERVRAVERLVAQIEEARGRLETQLAPQTSSVPIPVAAKYLEVSLPTIRSWADRGVLRRTDDDQIEREGLRSVHRALSELRAHGQDRNFLSSLLDYVDDRAARKRDAVKRGLEELARGELEPA